MADNTTLPGTGEVIATEEIGGVKYQLIKLVDSRNDSSSPIGVPSNPLVVQDENIELLRKIIQLLKPLNVVTGGGSNRLSIDVNAVTGNVAQVTLVPTVTTVGTVSNQTNIGGITAFEMLKSMNKSGLQTQRINMG